MFRTLWGVTRGGGGPMGTREALSKIKSCGYDGVETPIGVAMVEGKGNFQGLLQDNNLKYIGMCFSQAPNFLMPGAFGFENHPKPGESLNDHIDSLKAQIEECLEWGCYKINCHSGYDSFTRDEYFEFFDRILEFQRSLKTDVQICHETHRGRILHSPWLTRELASMFPDLKITADLSHYTCVTERIPKDQVLCDVVDVIAPQVYHIHGRIGYEHGPQVPDPRAERWEPYMEGFLAWWETIWRAAAARGDTEITFEPEHGPPNYQICDPYNDVPLADIWEVNNYIMARTKDHFNQLNIQVTPKTD